MSNTATLTSTALKTMSLKALASRANKVVEKATRSTVAARKALLRQDLEEFNVDRLLDLQEKMGKFIDLVTLGLGEAEVLDDKAKIVLMSQFLGQRDIGEFTDVVRDKIKEIAFAHIDATLEAEGVEDPENTPGVLEVPALGKKFCREGAGYSDPAINEKLLQGLLNDAQIARVFETKEIVKVERKLDLAKLMALVEEDPTVMLAVEEALTPGAPKNGRLVVRDL